MDSIKKFGLAKFVAIAMILGAILGWIVGPSAQSIKFIGDIWLNLLKMSIIPMVVFIVVKGITSMDSPSTLGRVSLKVAIYYGCTTIFASVIAIITTLVLQPGAGFHFEKATTAFKATKMLTFKEYITNLFSSNMFVSFYKGDMMQVLVMSIFIGLAVLYLKPEHQKPVKEWFNHMSELSMSLVNIIINLSPIGVFCLMFAAMGKYGISTLSNMAKMLGTFYVVCFIQVVVVYFGILWMMTGITPVQFLRGSMPVWVTAISTCSSSAVIPVNLMCAKKNFNVKDEICSFSIPFGAQFNQDGGAILSAVVILFSAQAIGVEFGMMQLLQMVLVCTLVSGGSGAIPGGGVVRLMITSTAFGMPLEIVALVAAFYRFFDMATTSTSVIGDLSGTIVIDRLESKRAA